MRRGFSILLILFFGLGPLSATAGASDGNATLPACCRRGGAHHCALAMQRAAADASLPPGSTPVVSTPLTCPYYPGAAVAITGPAPALVAVAAHLPVLAASFYSAAAVATPSLSIPNRTHAGRGPPANLLS